MRNQIAVGGDHDTVHITAPIGWENRRTITILAKLCRMKGL
jgi:hypothetical protein